MANRVLPKGFNLIRESFDYTTKTYPEKIGFEEKRPGFENYRQIRYKTFREDVISFGAALIEKLNLKGEKILVIGENSYEWAVCYYAVTCGAGIMVPLDKELPANEIENLARRSRAKAICYSSRKRDVVNNIRGKLPDLEYYIELYSDENPMENPAKGDKDYTFDELRDYGKELDESILMNVPIDPDEFKLLFFTSGTTAEAKGVMLTNRNLMSNANAAIKIVYLYEDDKFFSVLPIHHAYESTIGMVIPIYCGLTIAYACGLKTFKADIKETSPSVMLVVPALAENLIKTINKQITKQGKDKLVNTVINITNKLGKLGRKLKLKLLKEIHANLGGRVRIIVSAAAPIDPDAGKRIEDFGIMFIQGYGLTETSPLSCLIPHTDRRPDSVGIAAECCEVKIHEPNEDGIGEVWIKGENVTSGYYENEEETKKAFTDGWFHSGDLGYIDDTGFLYLTGRCKNLIITGNGKNVYPEEIENLINKIPEVNESLVYGADDPKDPKEQIIAVKVTLDENLIKEKYGNNRPTDEELHSIIWEQIKEINKTLVTYKWVKALEVKKEDFAKTTTMKIKRFEELKKK